MNALKPLIAMQLKDKVDFGFLKSWKKTLFKTIFFILKFALITAIIYIGFSLLSSLRLIDLNSGIPNKFLCVLFTIMILLSILSCTIGLVKSLYYAKDNQLLLTMPTNRVNIFFSKLIVYYIYEVIRNVTFILPLFLAFGLANSYSILFYIWLIPTFLIVTAVPVMIGALLSIPSMYISNFFKNFKILQYSFIVILIGFGVFAIITLISKIPSDFNLIESWGTTFWEIQDFLDNFSQIFVPFYYLMEMVVGTRYGISHSMFYANQWFCLLGTLALLVVLIGICYLIVRPLFFKIASSPFEYKKAITTKQKLNKKHNHFLTAVNKELRLLFRTPEKFYSLLAIAIGMPIAILLLNKIFNAMDTRLTGTYMTITFNVLMILLFCLSSNTVMAKAYSEEGHSSYLIKTNPQPYFNSLVAKLVPNAIIMTVSILATCIVFGEFGKQFVSVPLLFLAIEFIYISHLLWSAELDFMNPQYTQYATTGTHANNPNEVKSTIFMFILSALFAFMTYFMIGEGVTGFYFKMMFVALSFLAVRVYLYISKIKVYYKEK